METRPRPTLEFHCSVEWFPGKARIIDRFDQSQPNHCPPDDVYG